MSLREPVLHATPILRLAADPDHARHERGLSKARRLEDENGAGSGQVPRGAHGAGHCRSRRRQYLIDHHHLARALYEDGVEERVRHRRRRSQPPRRRPFLEHDGFPRLDASVRRQGTTATYSELPTTVKTMEDDPYRSLAGELRRIGGFAKDFDPVLGIRLGRFPEAAHQGQGDQGRFSRCAGAGALSVEDRRRRLPAWLVRPARLCSAATRNREGLQAQDSQGGLVVKIKRWAPPATRLALLLPKSGLLSGGPCWLYLNEACRSSY